MRAIFPDTDAQEVGRNTIKRSSPSSSGLAEHRSEQARPRAARSGRGVRQLPEGFQQLSGSPFRRAMRSHSKMNRTPTVVRENHQDEQNSERDRWNHEEIGRDQGLHGVLQKGASIRPDFFVGTGVNTGIRVGRQDNERVMDCVK